MAALRTHLTYANVMATVAVFCAIGGTAWALSANSVGSRQLKPKAVKTSDLAPNAVTSPKVKNGSLRRQDFAAGQIPAGDQGPVGPTGPQGNQGNQGPSALRLDFDQSELDNVFRVVGTQNELTIKTRCRSVGAQAEVQVQLNSSVAAEVNFFVSNDAGAPPTLANSGTQLPASTDTLLFGIQSGAGGFRRVESLAIYRNPSRVISLHLHAIADDVSDSCRVQGIATPAS